MVTISRKIGADIDECIFGYGGTEYIKAEDIMKLTENKSLEIRARGRGISLVLHLHTDKPPAGFSGRITVEEITYKKNDEHD